MSDYRILSVPTSTAAVVSTIGLRRVVTDDGEVLAELLPPDEARIAADTFNELQRTRRATVESYAVQRPFEPKPLAAGGVA